MHGFDEFFGNLYHLNAEEEPEDVDYPKDPEFRKRFGRAASCIARQTARAGRPSKIPGPYQKAHGDHRRRSRPTHAFDFIDEAHKAGKPFFVWYNTTAMHFRTHARRKHVGKSGQGDYNDVMVAHDETHRQDAQQARRAGHRRQYDRHVFDRQRPALQYLAGCRHHALRSEKNTNWEGGWRVPAFVRWPGTSSPGSVLNGIVSQQDWLPTLLAAAGEPDIAEKLHEGYQSRRARPTRCTSTAST